MSRNFMIAIGFAVLFGMSFLIQRSLRPERDPEPAQVLPQRLISLAPSTTELLFALDIGDRVVGVTRFCDYPPEADALPKVGGFFDPNYEAILKLEPDLIVLLEEHSQAQEHFASQGQRVLTVNHKTIDGILDSIPVVGQACGVDARAARLHDELVARMQRLAAQTQVEDPPTVLIVVSREGGKLGQIYIAGRDGFYSELLELAGGRNAYAGDLAFPVVTPEGILKLNPEVIIELVAEMDNLPRSQAEMREDWQQLQNVAAVQNGRLHLIAADYMTIPGPRFIQIQERFAELLHPDQAGD